MKCPVCGHWNKPNLPRCFKCGEPLDPRSVQKPEWLEKFEEAPPKKERAVYDDTVTPVEDLLTTEEKKKRRRESIESGKLAEEMTQLKDRRARGSVYLEEMRKNAAEQGIAPSGTGVSAGRGGSFRDEIPDDPAYTVQATSAEDIPEYDEESRAAKSSRRNARNYTPSPAQDPQYDPYFDADLPPPPELAQAIAPPGRLKHKRRRVRGPMRIAYTLVSILFAAMLIFGLYVAYTYFFPSGIGNSGLESNDGVFVEQTVVGGYPGYRIQIPGKEGAVVYIPELNRSYSVVDGLATIEVADHVFYDMIEPLDKNMETMDVTLSPTITHNSVETRMEPIRYVIDIPLSPVKLLTPESNNLSTTASIINMSLEVTPSSRVMVNGRDESDTVNEDGIVSYAQSIQAIGNNFINITVKAPYCRENTITVTVYRAPMDVPIELGTTTTTSTTSETVTIYGTTMTNATISVDSPHESIDTSLLNETGEFSVVALMSKVGVNKVILRASYPGKEDSTLEHEIYYTPPVNIYSRKAWALAASDYSELMNNINLRIQNAQIYLCRGEITEIRSNKPQIAVIDTGTDGRYQPVLLENRSDLTWELGKTYRVYADVSGVYNNMPSMIGRYSYVVDEEPPEGTNEEEGS